MLTRYGSRIAPASVWLFSVVGIIDIALAIALGISGELDRFDLGFNWYILNFYVPMLIVTHVVIIWRLRTEPHA